MKIPSLTEMEKALRSIEKMKFRAFKLKENVIDYSKEIYNQLINELGLPCNFIIPPVDLEDVDIRMFRARYVEGIKNPMLKCEFSYPPPSFCKKTLRANFPYHPVFYASDNALTATRELINNDFCRAEGKWIAISAWKFKYNPGIKISNFLLGNLSPMSNLHKASENILNKTINSFGDMTNDERKSIERIIRYYGELFIDKDYKLSAVLAFQTIYMGQSRFLMYPSIQTNKMNLNMALHPNFADKYLSLDGVIKARIKNCNSLTKDFDLDIYEFGVYMDNENIYWTAVDKADPNYQIYWPKIIKDFDLN